MLITLSFFWRDITCLTRIQVILKLLSFKLRDKLFKKPNYIGWVTWKRIDKTGQIVWSQFSVIIFGVPFDNSVIDNSNWDKISHSLTKKSIFRREYNYPSDEKKIFLSKLWYINQICSFPKFIKEETEKAIAQLSKWKCKLGILDIDTQSNFLKLKWI